MSRAVLGIEVADQTEFEKTVTARTWRDSPTSPATKRARRSLTFTAIMLAQGQRHPVQKVIGLLST